MKTTSTLRNGATILLVASGLFSSSGVGAASCSVCDGVEYREDLVIPSPEFNGATCKDAVLFAETYDDTDESCPEFRLVLEPFCCPSVALTCSICQGPTLLDDLEIPDTDGVTCGQLALVMFGYEATSANCTIIQDVEEFCCPDEYDPTTSTYRPTYSVTSPPDSRYVSTLLYY